MCEICMLKYWTFQCFHKGVNALQKLPTTVQLYLDCYSVSSVSTQNWYCRYVLCDFTDQQNTLKCRTKVKHMAETQQKIYMYYFPEQVSKVQ